MTHASLSMKMHALRVGVLRELRDALDDVDLALLPDVVERPVDLLVPLHRDSACAWSAPSTSLLAEVLEVHPGDVAAVAVVAVDVGVLAEERVGALRGGQPAHAAERRQVEPGVVLLRRVDVAVAERADALQVERLEDRVEALLGAVAVRVRLLRLRLDVEPTGPEEAAEVVEQEVPLDGHRTVVGDRAGVGVEVAQVDVVRA